MVVAFDVEPDTAPVEVKDIYYATSGTKKTIQEWLLNDMHPRLLNDMHPRRTVIIDMVQQHNGGN